MKIYLFPLKIQVHYDDVNGHFYLRRVYGLWSEGQDWIVLNDGIRYD